MQAPVEATWPVLLDLSRVSRCLPGATLEADGEGDYRGGMKVKLGPVQTEYTGTAKLEATDESAHTATVRVQGKETRGQGTASAVIQNRLEAVEGATRVVVETEINVTGRPAQFGRGIMQGVATRILDEFARCLEQEIAQTAGQEPEPPPGSPEWASMPIADALDLGSAARGALGRRAGLLAGAAGVLLLARRLLRRR